VSDVERIARLTELARRMWPHAFVATSGRPDFAAVDVFDAEGHYKWSPMAIHHARALAALEAALRVLAEGEQ
jgi:hypothetical protein